jgi:hypothetical protein
MKFLYNLTSLSRDIVFYLLDAAIPWPDYQDHWVQNKSKGLALQPTVSLGLLVDVQLQYSLIFDMRLLSGVGVTAWPPDREKSSQ